MLVAVLERWCFAAVELCKACVHFGLTLHHVDAQLDILEYYVRKRSDCQPSLHRALHNSGVDFHGVVETKVADRFRTNVFHNKFHVFLSGSTLSKEIVHVRRAALAGPVVDCKGVKLGVVED